MPEISLSAEEDKYPSIHSHKIAMSTSTAEKERRKSIHSSRSLGILIALIGGLALLSSSSYEGARKQWMRSIPSMSQRMAGLGVDCNKQTKVARYDNATSRPGRLFRKHDESRHAAMPMPRDRDSTPQSTYEQLWPGYNLPGWAHKVRRFHGFRPPKGLSICYVHVGKTAGSSIGCALGFRLHCAGERQYLPGRLPKSTTHAFHKDVYDCPDATDYYLFVARDPLERSRSAFVYGRPSTDEDAGDDSLERRRSGHAEEIYSDCSFSTANDLAASGLAPRGGSSEECKRRARDMLRGVARFEDHLYFNYQYYLESIPHGARVLAVRTEHMEEDWNEIERGLGGRLPGTNVTFPRSNSKAKEARDSELGGEERRLLCHELCVEIQYYKMLLRSAENIDDSQYDTSMRELQASCPNEAVLKQCDFHTPNIEKKLQGNRGYPTN